MCCLKQNVFSEQNVFCDQNVGLRQDVLLSKMCRLKQNMQSKMCYSLYGMEHLANCVYNCAITIM